MVCIDKAGLHVLRDGGGGKATLGPGLDGGRGNSRRPCDAVACKQRHELPIPWQPNDVAKLESPIDQPSSPQRGMRHRRIEKRCPSRGLWLERVVRVKRIAARQTKRDLTTGIQIDARSRRN